MKGSIAVLALSVFFISLKAQLKLPGRFKYITEQNDSLAFNYVLDLNCDKTFKMFDSASTSTVTGTWYLKKEQEVILSIDTTKLRSEVSNKKRKWKYLIKNDRLYEKLMTKAEYEKQTKRLNKSISKQTAENSLFEDYDTFKAKQENRYLIKIEGFSCL